MVHRHLIQKIDNQKYKLGVAAQWVLTNLAVFSKMKNLADFAVSAGRELVPNLSYSLKT